ncbi:Family 31 glycoside hydrolase, partial [Globisporangium splendens]
MALTGLGRIRLGQILLALACALTNAQQLAETAGFNDANGVRGDNNGNSYNVAQAGTYAIASDVAAASSTSEVSETASITTPTVAGYVNTAGYAVTKSYETSDRLVLELALNKNQGAEVYGPDLKELVIEVTKGLKDAIRVKISDKNQNRWEVPKELYAKGALGDVNYGKRNVFGRQSDFQFSYTRIPFSFKVTRRTDGYVVFDSSKLSLVVKDQYLQIATAVDADLSIYGLGESTHENMRLNVGDKHTLWARDQFSLDVNVNLYGSHPFYLGLNGKGKAHGVLLLNSNGMDITLEKDKLVYQTLGGVLDFHIVAGPTPADVVSQYTALIGRPKLQPYWSYGFHQCRWGYQSAAALREVVNKYAAGKIPLDVIWADIDHMNKFYDFTLDPVNFPAPEMQSLLADVHARGQKFVPIIDPGIPDDKTDYAYSRGLELDVFIKDTKGKPYLGQVWPGPTVFPDFFHPNASSYWSEQLDKFHKTLPFDGIWLDMNELANFCPGTTCARKEGQTCPLTGSISNLTTCCLECVDDINKYDHPPFAINNANTKDDLFHKGISANALQYNGIRQYDAHNLYGFTEGIATNNAQEQLFGKRSFVLSRSTFPGAGAYVAHWTGDNGASWNDMQYSIPQILNFGLYGIPMVGSDICGFIDNTTEELCARWTALGAFYPFARNHNNFGNIPHETYVWDSVAAIGRKFLGIRYRLLPYFYTLGYQAYVMGAPIARALFYEFPGDKNARVSPAVDRQFLLGSALLVTPVLTQGATSVTGYVPAGIWYDLFTYARVESTGQSVTWNVALDEMPVHIRGGSILPLHQAALTSAAARTSPFDLVVALGDSGDATGQLYLDDGEDVNPDGKATLVEFRVDSNLLGATLSSKIVANNYKGAAAKTLNKLVVLGVKKQPSLVLSNVFAHVVGVTYDASTQRLEVDLTPLNAKVTDALNIFWR